MSNAATRPNRFTHNVVAWNGFKIPCNGLADAQATLARLEARGAAGKIVLVQG